LFQIDSPPRPLLLTRRETLPVVAERPAYHVHDGVGDRPESLALVGAEALVAGQQDERPRGVEPLDDDLREATLLIGRFEKIELPQRAADGLRDLAAADETQYAVKETAVEPRFLDIFRDHHNLKTDPGKETHSFKWNRYK